MSGSRTVGDVILKMECDNREMLRSLIDIEMKTAKITGDPIIANCPNCGAPIVGPSCEYCGTIFDLDYLKQLTRRRSDAETYSKVVKELESYSCRLEFTSEEVDHINTMMQIANLTASETRRLRGI